MKTQLLRMTVLGCSIALAVSCNRAPGNVDTQQAAEDVKAAATRAGDQLADSWLTTKIQAQYFADDDIKARYLNVSTHDGVVTLGGRVENQNAHDQAVEIAKSTDGVREVRDNLTIGPATEASNSAMPERMDAAWIATKIQAKYFADPNVKARDINVSASNGVVTLSGHVNSDAERQHAIDVAKGTDGVMRVEDHLAVQPGAVATTGTSPGEIGRSVAGQIDDARITGTIQSKYFLDDLVKGRKINVDAHQGVVTLQGEVSSQSERAQALLLARTTEGVQRVEDNLRVANAAAATPGGGNLDDEMLTTKLQSKFFLDNLVRRGSIEVTSKDGVVLLQGTVPTAAAKKQALSIARNTDGVVQVVDRLRVRQRR